MMVNAIPALRTPSFQEWGMIRDITRLPLEIEFAWNCTGLPGALPSNFARFLADGYWRRRLCQSIPKTAIDICGKSEHGAIRPSPANLPIGPIPNDPHTAS